MALAAYHDQGMIPLKLYNRDRMVNVTLGLPFIRTSPAHGTAYDIAGKHRASPGPHDLKSYFFGRNVLPMRQPFGQHFSFAILSVAKTIVAAAELTSKDVTLEIGPGRGVLTGEILGRGGRFIAKLEEREHQEAQGCDVSSWRFSRTDALLKDRPERSGNLPYSITSPHFEKVGLAGWEASFFSKGRRTYGQPSRLTRLRNFKSRDSTFCGRRNIVLVKPGAFNPPPRVTSAVIRVRRKKTADLSAEKIPDFFDLVHGAFAHRRKTIANSLAMHAKIPRIEVEKWLRKESADPGARAETLGLTDYVKLAGAWSVFRREMNLTFQNQQRLQYRTLNF